LARFQAFNRKTARAARAKDVTKKRIRPTKDMETKSSPNARANRLREMTKTSVSAKTPPRIAAKPDRWWASSSQALHELKFVVFFKALVSCIGELSMPVGMLTYPPPFVLPRPLSTRPGRSERL
jgi:hypothetical protein